MGERIKIFDSAGIELPHGWHREMERLAKDAGLKLRELYTVAVAQALSMSADEVRDVYDREYRAAADRNYVALVRKRTSDPAAIAAAQERAAARSAQIGRVADPPKPKPIPDAEHHSTERERFGEFIDEVLEPGKAKRSARKRRGA